MIDPELCNGRNEVPTLMTRCLPFSLFRLFSHSCLQIFVETDCFGTVWRIPKHSSRSSRVAKSNSSGYSHLPSSTFFAVGEQAIYPKSPVRLTWQIRACSAR